MAIGSSINTSIPTIGTTVDTLTKSRQGFYQGKTTITSVDFPTALSLRPAGSAMFNRRRFGATYQVKPADTVSPVTSDKGSLTVSVNIDATVGSVITNAELAKQVRYALSALLASTLVEQLSTGSLE